MSATLAPLQNSATPFGGADSTQKIERVYFTVTPAGNYAGAPGDAMSFANLGDLVKSSQPPIACLMWSNKAGGASGYEYNYVPGSSRDNGTFQVMKAPGAAGPMVDIGAGAYPVGVSGDSIIGFADFLRNI